MSHALADDHEWKPGPVTEWDHVFDASMVVAVEARAMVVVCECGEWRRVPTTDRYRGRIEQRTDDR